MSLKCTICKSSKPVFKRAYSGEVLCEKCFSKTFIKRVIKTISRYNMLQYNDKIGVAVSGGKDSLTLLHILYKIEKRFPQSQLFAITIDEGIEGYREESLKIVVDNCKKLGIKHIVSSFKEAYGASLDEMIKISHEKNIFISPCTLCGILRRRLLFHIAKNLNLDVLATAHTLDDIVQTYFLNMLRGDINIFRKISNEKPKLITPFRLTPEKEVAFYAYLKGYYLQSTLCKYAYSSARNFVRNFLNQYETNYPGALFTALHTFEKFEISKEEESKKEKCIVCGEKSSKKMCRVCEVLSKLGLRPNF
ncbi:MAG: TIGR00269 family protein [Nitrososphaerota archaeon]